MDDDARLNITGLSPEEVAERVDRGQVNEAPEHASRSVAAIIRENTLTLFNAILSVLLVLILAVGAVKDALFGLVLIGNMLIGIVQELRAKVTLDRLTVISASKARVIRGGRRQEIDIAAIVLDDVVELKRGDQVVADAELLDSSGLEVDESLLTGEAEPVDKQVGDKLLSGSFVVAGAGTCRVTGVGADAYARKLTAEAKHFKLVHSELRSGINRILAGITWVMIPVGLVLFWRELGSDSNNVADSVSGAVAAMVGMIPQGLVLLTSIAFAVAVILLGRKQVLVQELPAVEGLARVDVVCFDKTGTLTEAGLKFEKLELIASGMMETAERNATGEIGDALAALAADESSRNPTMDAVAEAFPPGEGFNESGVERVPFSSERKWSAVAFGGTSWVMGAPEILLAETADTDSDVRKRVAGLAAEGMRVLLIARTTQPLSGDNLPHDLNPAALLLLEEKIRGDAADTLAYFAAQGVSVKIISGDNPVTVAAVARRVGLEVGEPVDGRSLPEDPGELADVMERRTVFGRVSARQKKEMVKALQARGHVVVMSGDGVNDTLAVKEAEIGIAVGKGAAAPTKAVAQLVLLDGRFATMPDVVAEGRRVIANIERVAYLFVTKTAYATLLAVTIAILGWPYPFLPRHMTLVDAITIGIPAFFLALAPSKELYRPGFVNRVLHFAVPAGVLLGAGTMLSYWLARSGGADLEQSRTMATITLTVMGLGVLVILARPLTPFRVALIAAMILALVLASITPLVRDFLAFEFPSPVMLAQSLAVGAASIILLLIGMKITGWRPRRS